MGDVASLQKTKMNLQYLLATFFPGHKMKSPSWAVWFETHLLFVLYYCIYTPGGITVTSHNGRSCHSWLLQLSNSLPGHTGQCDRRIAGTLLTTVPRTNFPHVFDVVYSTPTALNNSNTVEHFVKLAFYSSAVRCFLSLTSYKYTFSTPFIQYVNR